MSKRKNKNLSQRLDVQNYNKKAKQNQTQQLKVYILWGQFSAR